MTYLDDEVERIHDDAGATQEDRQAADSWRATWERRWSEEVRAKAAVREQRTAAKQDVLYDHVREEQRKADADLRAFRAGEMSTSDFLNASARVDMKADEFERRLQGLESAESIIEEMRGDPVEWMDTLFDKWTVIQHSRPRLDDWLHESRENRRRDRSAKRAKSGQPGPLAL